MLSVFFVLMSISFAEHTSGAAPLLIARDVRLPLPQPLVLWFHGFGADAAVHRPELERVANRGFLAVGVDAVGHGRRRFADLDARIAAPRDEALHTAVEIARDTADEVPWLVRSLVGDGLADASRVAIAGISMGAFIVYRALVVASSIRAAVAILGSPEWPVPDSPHTHLDAFRRTALLSITAENDVNVPPDAARALHRRLTDEHPGSKPSRYVELAGGQHLMSAGHWHVAMEETLQWLTRHNL